LAIAHAYVEAGANVFLCSREAETLEKARAEVEAKAGLRQIVMAQICDVSKPRDVQRLASHALEAFGRLHILVNNAGGYGPMGPIEEIDWDEWIAAIEINLYGSILMYRAVLPHFKQHSYGKIIQLSGGGATGPLPRLSAYAASKAAIVRTVEGLAQEVSMHSIDVNAIAPGALNTHLLDEVLEAGPEKVGKAFYARMIQVKREGGTPLSEGANLAVFLGSAASDGITGKLISAVWDPWDTFAEHRDELKSTDVYTLRRIVPKDRGLEWGERGN
jgi:NAD(P)-dependent dehydrogenase (short-subunit alcohol dehydrogenase family)